MKIRRGSNPYKLLRYLMLRSGVVVLSLVAPQGGARVIQELVAGYFRKKRFERERFLRDLKSLQERKLISYRELDGGKVEIVLTKQGKEKALVYDLDAIKLKIPKRWDKKWRVVIFDIPHLHKKARDSFRKKLSELEFYPLQKSVFITPYPCEDEIDFIASLFNIRHHVLILTVSYFEGAEKLVHHYGLEI